MSGEELVYKAEHKQGKAQFWGRGGGRTSGKDRISKSKERPRRSKRQIYLLVLSSVEQFRLKDILLTKIHKEKNQATVHSSRSQVMLPVHPSPLSPSPPTSS